jgi:hypothetical protein
MFFQAFFSLDGHVHRYMVYFSLNRLQFSLIFHVRNRVEFHNLEVILSSVFTTDSLFESLLRGNRLRNDTPDDERYEEEKHGSTEASHY